MAVIDFGLKTVELFRRIYETGQPDPELVASAARLGETSVNVNSLIAAKAPHGGTAAERNLREIVTDCLACAKEVEDEVARISPRQHGTLAKVASVLKTIRRKHHLERLKARLDSLNRIMDTSLGVQILEQVIDSGQLNVTTLESLRQEQKDFVTKHAQASEKLQVLLKEESRATRDHVATEHARTRDDMARREETREYKSACDRLVNSLKYPRMNERKHSVKTRHDKTFDWIFDTDYAQRQQFVKWLKEDIRYLFWITGKPGSGKSTFMKFIQDDERTLQALNTWHDTPAIISHYLWKAGGVETNKACMGFSQVLLKDRHLVIRLLGDSLALSAKDDETDWSVDELKAPLFKSLRSTPRSYFVLLDGLDEVERRPGSIGQLLSLVHDLLAENQVKVCVSSRAERPFELGFNDTPHTSWRMQDLTRNDISEYTHDFLRTVGLDSEDLLSGIRRTILLKAQGVFLWVYLVLANIKLGIEHYNEDWDGIHERIKILPQDLIELYRDMLSRLDEHREVHIAQAARYFSIARLFDTAHDILEVDFTIVSLTIASNEQILERFSTVNELPDVRELVLACSHTLKTLPSVCAGLRAAVSSIQFNSGPLT